jgi:hypothetical protein
MCRHHDVGKAKQCREPMAEEVKDKTRANFCDWFQITANAFMPAAIGDRNARSALDDLFGDANAEKSDVKPDLDRLFGD